MEPSKNFAGPSAVISPADPALPAKTQQTGSMHRGCCRNATPRGARSMGAAQRSHQVAAEIVVIYLERVARRFLEVPMRGFAADPGGNVGGTRQVIGEPPDASDRLK